MRYIPTQSIIDEMNRLSQENNLHVEFEFRDNPHFDDKLICMKDYDTNKDPHIFFHSVDNRTQKCPAHFTYGNTYVQYLPYNKENRPVSETNFNINKSDLQIGRQLFKMFIACYKYWIQEVKPRQEADEQYKNRLYIQLNKLANIMGEDPISLSDITNGKNSLTKYTNGAYARKVQGGSSVNMELCSLTDEQAEFILNYLYGEIL